jgi:hypothetical protein
MQTVWHIDEVKRHAESGVVIAPTREFAAGIVWLARSLNVDWRPYEVDMMLAQPEHVLVEVTQ